MQSAFIVNDRSGKPYALVALLNGGTEFYPITENARSWSGWMKDEFAAKKITREELIATLDNSMQVEGPLAANRINKVKFDELLKKAKKPAQVVAIETAKVPEEKTLVPVISLMDVYLSDLEDDDWRNAVNFKAKSFIADSNKSTYGYEVKRTRAVWDDSLSIPGTDRRGGWRCPVGTRYGGQITDRFGRNCGWGVARRLANAITNIGERIEDADDKRRGRRVARRNERMVRRLQQGGRLERAARGVANALETGDQPSPRQIEAPRQPRDAGLVERAAGRIGRALDTPQRPRQPRNRRGPAAPQRERDQRGGVIERLAGQVAEGLETDQRGVRNRRGGNEFDAMSDDDLLKDWQNNEPYMPRNGRIGMDPGIEQRKRERRRALEREMRRRGMQLPEGADPLGGVFDLDNEDNVPSRRPAPNRRPAAPRAPQARPARPRQPRQPRPNQPRQPRPVDTVSRTPVPAGAPNPGESLDAYKRRKYNEHQANVRKIREQGGNAGFLRYNEWEAFHGPVVEENWRRANPNAPSDSTPPAPAAPPAQRPRRPRQPAGRNNRRVATEANAGRTATRRPTPNDVPDANQPPRRQRRVPFTPYGHQRGLSSEEAAWRKVDQINADANNIEMRDLHVVELNGKHYIVNGDEALQRAVDAGAVRKLRGGREGMSSIPLPGESQINRNPQDHDEMFENGAIRLQQAFDQIEEGNQDHIPIVNQYINYLNDFNERNHPNNPDRKPGALPVPISFRQWLKQEGISLQNRPSNNNARTPRDTPRRPGQPRPPAAGMVRHKDNQPPLGPIGNDGLPHYNVPLGNKGINNNQQAADHLKNGGDIADIPDDLLRKALDDNAGEGKRFEKTRPRRRGVNAVYIYTDSVTGKQYFIKYAHERYADNEDIHEIVGNNIAGRLGFPVGGFRFAEPVGGRDGFGARRAIVFEHVGNYLEGTAREAATIEAIQRMLPADKVRATVLDFIILNRDRHHGNFFIIQEGQNERFVPIDPSLGFNADDQFPDDLVSGSQGFRRWMRHSYGGRRNSMLGQLADADDAEILAAVISMQEQLRISDAATGRYGDFANGVIAQRGGGIRRDRAKRIVEDAQERMDYIRDADPAELVREIKAAAREIR